MTLPATVDEMTTPDWMTSFLQGSFPGVVVEAVDVLDVTHGTADRLRLGFRYAAGRDAGLPPQLFLKTVLGDSEAWAAMFRREVDFYALIRPALDLETPRIFGVDLEPGSDRFLLLMEDVTLRGARFLDVTHVVTVDDAAGILSTLARLHAPYWGSRSLDTEFGFLEVPNKGDNYDNFLTLGPGLLNAELETDLKARLAGELHRSPDFLFDAFRRLADLDAAETPTVTHGDVHVGNTYLVPDGPGGILDWQFTRRCHGVHDVAYFLTTALDTEVRAAHERELIAHYCEELRAHSVEDVTPAALFELYRRDAMWGVLMWLLTPTSMHREEILETSFLRCLRATEDLETFVALGC